MATTFLCYLGLAYDYQTNQLNGIISPLVFVFILSYFVSSMFSEIFGMGIQCLLFCYIADEEMFEPGKRYADDGLNEMISKTKEMKQEMKIAEKSERQSIKRAISRSFKGSSTPKETENESTARTCC